MFLRRSQQKQKPIQLESFKQLLAADDAQLFDFRREDYVPKTDRSVIAPTLGYLAGLLRDLGYKKQDIDVPVRHEGAHAAAAMAVNATRVFFPLEFDEAFRPMFSTVCTGVFSKLALASIALAPIDPSLEDLLRIPLYGYESYEDIKSRIIRWNAENDLQMVVPPITCTETLTQISSNTTKWQGYIHRRLAV